MKRVVACALALCLPVCLFAGTASAAAREPISKFTIPLADNVNLIEMTHAGGIFTDPKDVLQQHALTYQPGSDVRPMVIYGSTLYGRSTMSKIATYLDNQNLSLVAGVNGSFFDILLIFFLLYPYPLFRIIKNIPYYIAKTQILSAAIFMQRESRGSSPRRTEIFRQTSCKVLSL